MEVLKLADMKGGWFVGDFEPTAYKTKDFEVSYKVHKKGEQWDYHYHMYITEINLLAWGRMIIQGKELKGGDIFIMKPYEIADPLFLEDCYIVCVKTPSIAGDKVKITVIRD
jgi:hypothetical protein